MQMAWHDPLTAIYDLMFAAFLAIGAIEVVDVLYRSIPSRYRKESGRGRPSLQRALLIAMVLLGWGAVLLGTFWVYPEQSLAHSSHAWGSRIEIVEWKERLTLMAAMVMTMVAYVLIRYREVDAEQQRLRTAASALGLVVLIATGTASALGVLAYR